MFYSMQACITTSVRNGDVCSMSCPTITIFDPSQNLNVPNPEFKFEIDGLCVIPCPGESN